MTDKKTFILYTDNIIPVSLLTDEEAGQLFKIILDYVNGGEIPPLSGKVEMAFAFIRRSLDINAEKYADMCEKRREAGRKGGKQRQANASAEKQKQTNQADNDTVIETVTVTGTETVTVTETENESVSVNEKKGGSCEPAHTRFVKPSVKEVNEYCRENGYDVDAQRFVDYYTTNGWVQGKGSPIQDWKACVRTWAQNGLDERQSSTWDHRPNSLRRAAKPLPGALVL